MELIIGLVYNITMNNKANNTSFKKGNIPKCPFKKGQISPMKGKKRLDIPWNKGKKTGLTPPNKGKKMSELQRINLSEKRRSFTGVKSGNWKGGITPEIRRIRNSLEIKLWRKSCLERDNFTDQKTGVRGGNLAVHHINNFADFPELRTSISNGITLSKKSHLDFHNKYGRKNNTKEQLIEFLKN